MDASLGAGKGAEDSVVQAIIKKFLQRSELGKKKYGVTLDRTDLAPLDWIQHAQEELMDGILYLEKLKQMVPLPRPSRK
jgi:hypothetical protein